MDGPSMLLELQGYVSPMVHTINRTWPQVLQWPMRPTPYSFSAPGGPEEPPNSPIAGGAPLAIEDGDGIDNDERDVFNHGRNGPSLI